MLCVVSKGNGNALVVKFQGSAPATSVFQLRSCATVIRFISTTLLKDADSTFNVSVPTCTGCCVAFSTADSLLNVTRAQLLFGAVSSIATACQPGKLVSNVSSATTQARHNVRPHRQRQTVQTTP